MKKGIIAFLTIVFFCNFGRVEYSALNPKAKTIQLDSTVKSASVSTSTVEKTDTVQTEQDSADATEENLGWSTYLVLGMKTIVATLLKLLVA
ncbi:hypothetical protein SKC37_04835 [Aquirufa sp. HETE-83D]|uniref:DUF4134 domain-containing protein n=1 Tax=Aquirufa esocilacus TaxID=3096513 RepID=A0ABW6DJU0_9BACT